MADQGFKGVAGCLRTPESIVNWFVANSKFVRQCVHWLKSSSDIFLVIFENNSLMTCQTLLVLKTLENTKLISVFSYYLVILFCYALSLPAFNSYNPKVNSHP